MLAVPRDQISQGDIIEGIDVVDDEEGRFATRPANVFVLSHDCEFDKPYPHALVLEVRRAASVDSGIWGDIQRGRVWSAVKLPLPPNAPAALVDFRRVFRVSKDDIRRVSAGGGRKFSCSDEERLAVVYAFMSFILHDRLKLPLPEQLPLGDTM